MWPNDISSAVDNAIFINRAENIECSFDCVARIGVLLKRNVAHILLFNFCEQKFVQHSPITIAINCNGLSLLIFEEKWRNYASGLKFAPNRQFLCLQIRNQNGLHLKRWFFFQNRSICRNISQRCSNVYTTIFVRRKDKTNYLSNLTWAKCYHLRNKP